MLNMRDIVYRVVRGRRLFGGRSDLAGGDDDALRALGRLLAGAPPGPGLEWGAVVDLARRYGVSPLLFWRLGKQKSPGVSVPEAAWRALRDDYYAAVAQAALRERELARILTALDQVKVLVLLLKGAALARTVYPDPALRQMGDLDLLIHRDDLELARQTLETLGYVHQPEPPQRFNPFNTEFTGEVSFLHTAGGHSTLVELHWVLLPSDWLWRTITLDRQALWARAVSLQVGDVTALSLAPEDALAHVCLHLAMHGFSHLRGYTDIVQMIEAGQVNWDVFVERVQQSRIRVACYFPLWWAKQAWSVPVPGEVLRALRPGPLRTRLGRWMTERGTRREPDVEHTWNHAAQMLVVDRARDLLQVLLWLLFPGPAWLRERYRLHSTWQAWVWVVVHPLVVLWEGVRSLGAMVGQCVE